MVTVATPYASKSVENTCPVAADVRILVRSARRMTVPAAIPRLARLADVDLPESEVRRPFRLSSKGRDGLCLPTAWVACGQQVHWYSQTLSLMQHVNFRIETHSGQAFEPRLGNVHFHWLMFI